MKLYLKNHDYRYAAEQILLTMFPDQRPEYPEGAPEGDRAEISLFRGEVMASAYCRLYFGASRFDGRASVRESELTDDLTTSRLLQRIVKLAFYRAAVRLRGEKPIWGSLTGIRPATLARELLGRGMSGKAAATAMRRQYDVSAGRAELCVKAAQTGLEVRRSLKPEDICLYIGIPFCPTRCAYCSFVSQSVEKSMALIEPFIGALYREIDATAQVVRRLGLRVVSVYIGGGTPTTLSAAQMGELCAHLNSAFDLAQVRDYTVEAGRPDTITDEKLAVLMAHGVRRVSVNPQSMDDSVLEAIGRRHTAQDVIDAAVKVRAQPGLSFNMDLIAGLPGDSPEGFERTLDAVLALGPENITVHTLALKKGSRITLEGTALPDDAAVGNMIDAAGASLSQAGYSPYYLYRQKFMSGGFENVGWCLEGCENLYNICIMEELCSIISMGGGASTKLVTGTGRIERMFAPKYPKEYIDNIEKTCADKLKIVKFYDGIILNTD